MTEKDQQFTRMWNEANKSKREKFRNLLKSKLAARRIMFNESNARAYWNGDVAMIQPERIYEERPREERFERRPPPRRGGGRGGPRGGRGGRGGPGGRGPGGRGGPPGREGGGLAPLKQERQSPPPPAPRPPPKPTP